MTKQNKKFQQNQMQTRPHTCMRNSNESTTRLPWGVPQNGTQPIDTRSWPPPQWIISTTNFFAHWGMVSLHLIDVHFLSNTTHTPQRHRKFVTAQSSNSHAACLMQVRQFMSNSAVCGLHNSGFVTRSLAMSTSLLLFFDAVPIIRHRRGRWTDGALV